MSFSKDTKFILHPDYLPKSLELKAIKESFTKWNNTCKSIDKITLNKSLAIIKKYKIEFPRIVMPSILYPMKFYRARICSSIGNDDISDPRTFSYPPKIEDYQRANVPGHPVFYGASDAKTALEELRFNGKDSIKKGDEIYLSEWKIKDGVRYNLGFLTSPNVVDKGSQFSEITNNIYSQFIRIFQNKDIFFHNKQLCLFNLVSELFLTGRYVQSGTIAYQVLYNTPEVDGITIDGLLYPSCSNNYRSSNCAFHPNFVDEHMELVHVRKMSFKSFTDNGANTTGNYFGVNENNKIIWKQYVSQLDIDNYEVGIEPVTNGGESDHRNVPVYYQEKEIDIKSYIKTIDLSNYKILQNYGEFNKSNKRFLLQPLKDCYIKSSDKTININAIYIKIPVHTYLEKVNSEFVKNKKIMGI